MAPNARITMQLRDFPIFTVNDVAKLLRRRSYYTKIFLSRLAKKGVITRICRGKYTMQDDPLAFSSLLYSPSYLAFWTALSFHGMTEQIPNDIFVATARKRAVIPIKGIKIIARPIKDMWGFERSNYKGFSIFVSDKEKTIIDCLNSGLVPVPILYDSFEATDINTERLVHYLLRMGNSSLAKRCGWIMEQKGVDLISQLSQLIDNNYALLEKNGKKTGKKILKWRIIENIKAK